MELRLGDLHLSTDINKVYEENRIEYNAVNQTLTSMFMQMRANWRPPSLSELTPIISDMGLTHLGSDASNFTH